MSKIKVFIVDDSATVRKVISDMLDATSDITVIGTAQDPLFAKPKMEKNWPDVIILDIEMPRKDGITYLKEIMTEHPTPVVMCSNLTNKGCKNTLKAIEYGAVEFVTKPKVNIRDSLQDSSNLLIDAVRAAARADIKKLQKQVRRPQKIAPKLAADIMLRKRKVYPAANGISEVIAIGTSTGGTQALETILPALSADVPGILVVQHMPENFTRTFAQRLDSLCVIKVKEAVDMEKFVPGQAFVAQGGKHMMLEMDGRELVIRVKDGPLVNRHRPSVDVLFRSVANVAGEKALGIIMTGMGDDGANGLKEMRSEGAHTIAQDEASSVVYGMPAEAVKRGGVDKQLSLYEIPDEINKF